MRTSAIKVFTMWCSGAFCYGLIELAFRGKTHISMGLLGGICIILINEINEKATAIKRLPVRMIICATVITTLELVTGLIVNRWLALEVWDYSDIPFNFCGQICPIFFFVWYGLSYVAVLLSKAVRIVIFHEAGCSIRIPVLRRKEV